MTKQWLFGTPKNYPFYVKATRGEKVEGYSGVFKQKKGAVEFQKQLKPFGKKGVTYRIIDRRK